jgi:site-specific recombinase XerD
LLAATNDPRNKAIIRLLFDSGCRLSEITAIKAGDFDWPTHTAKVIGKGNKQRFAPFTKTTEKLLKQWFSSHDSFELKNAGVQDMLEKLEKQTGIKCNPHCFRRGFAVHQLKRGLSTRIVQILGGWESITMVEAYSKQLSNNNALRLYASKSDTKNK